MADEGQLQILMQGVDVWNDWRISSSEEEIDLSEADLRRADLCGANLVGVSLYGADLTGANLTRAEVRLANLIDARLSDAVLVEADLRDTTIRRATLVNTDLSGADLRGAECDYVNLTMACLDRIQFSKTVLFYTNFGQAALKGADFSQAYLGGTIFSDVDLSVCTGLESCVHTTVSSIDFQTLARSGPLPLVFLRGIGLSDTLIDQVPLMLSQPNQLYSCFISYSAKDEEFVRRLHADLQDKGVRCWFAPEDMRIGAKILDTLDQAIRLRDKVLLVLSEASIASDWVEDEVTKGFAEERQRGGVVLFPVRIDDAVFATNEAWAIKLRDNRNIGDFRRWKDHDAYQQTLVRLLRDLRVEATV
jgi:hypothetical protein